MIVVVAPLGWGDLCPVGGRLPSPVSFRPVPRRTWTGTPLRLYVDSTSSAATRLEIATLTTTSAERTATTDDALVHAMARGDADAMARLYDRWSAALFGLALRITREKADAEEVVVDAFAQAWRDASRFEAGRGSVGAWLAMIARSRALDLVRSSGRRQRLNDSAAIESADAPVGMGGHFPSPGARVEDDERARKVREALDALPAAQRTTLELAYFEGLSQSEIADRLAEPLGTVKTRVRLGLRRLRELLANLGPLEAS